MIDKEKYCCSKMMKSLNDERYRFAFFDKESSYYSILPYGAQEKTIIPYCPWCGTDLALFEKIGIAALWRNRKPETDFCCYEMRDYVNEEDPPVIYNRQNREYSLWNAPGVLLNCCPWCHVTTPSSLKAERDEILKEVLGGDYKGDNDSRVPEEFKTDEWWLRRGIW